MRADSSPRDPLSSLINEDAAIMKVIHPSDAGRRGKATSALAYQMLSGCVPVKLVALLWQPRAHSALQGSFATLVVTNADRLIHTRQKNLSVSNLPRARRSQHGLHRLLHHRVGQYHLDLRLRNQIHAALSPAVYLGMPLLPPMAAHLA